MNYQIYFKTQNKKYYYKQLNILLLIFQIFGLLLAILSQENYSNMTLYLSLGFILVSNFINFIFTKYIKTDHTFIYLVNLLYSISVIMLMRLDSSQVNKHIIWYFVGIVLSLTTFYIMKYIDRFLRDKYILFFIITLLTFIITLSMGFMSGGARNWISIGGIITIQLSEFAKISYIFMIASYYYSYEKLEKFKYHEYYLAIATYIFGGLFFLQGELGTAMVFFALMISAIFIFEKRYLFISLNIIIALAGVFLASLVLSHIKVRIDTWLNPWADFNGRGYQIIQSLYAIANGGFFGTGIGLGSPHLVPVVESDFIVTAIIEEMGMFMGFAIIMIYILIFYKAIKISLIYDNKFLSSLSLSIGIIFAFQALIMLGGILKLIPLTGITTPFLSYGGSSTISNFILLGVLYHTSGKLGDYREK